MMTDDLRERVDLLRWQLRSRIQRSRYISMTTAALAASTREGQLAFRAVLRNLRHPQRPASFGAQRHDRIDASGAVGGHERRDDADGEHH